MSEQRNDAGSRSLDDARRMDILTEFVSADPTTGEILMRIFPDPRRYEWRDEQGETVLYDRFDDTTYAKDFVMALIKRSLTIKPLAQPQLLGDAVEYVSRRAETIHKRLKGELPPEPRADIASTVLERYLDQKHTYVALVVDIVGSTRLAKSIGPDAMARLIRVVLDEMSALLQPFYGHVLKYTGDGLIAFFAAPNFIRMNDHALDCALTLRRLVYSGLDPALREWGYPPVDIRIGMEGGEGISVVIGSADTRRSVDLLGDFINMAAKLQAIAPPGGIFIGYMSERNLHVGWRQQLKEVTPQTGWDYLDGQKNRYRVFAAPDLSVDELAGQPEQTG